MGKSYKDQFKDEDGVWRTIGGRRVFIRNGQSLSDAMKESGKFKTGNRREVQQALAEKRVEKLAKRNTELYKKYGGFADTGDKEKNKEVDKYHKEWLENAKQANELKDMYNDYSPLGWEKDTYNNPKEYTGDLSKLEGKHIYRNKYATNNESGYDDNTSAYADKALDYWQKQREDTLARGGDTAWEDDSIKRWEKEKENRLYGEKEKDLKLTNNNFKNNWQDEIKTKEQLIEKEKEVKQQYEDYKKQVEEHRKNWNETTIRKNEESYQKTLQNIEDWKKEFDDEKTIHTQSGDYSYKELKERDENVKQMYKDMWNNKMSAKELHDKLEKMKSDGKISEGELKSLQYDASEESRQNETGFVQQTDMYGGTYEYTNARLKQMEEAGTKPMAHSYTGGGWEGTKYDSSLSTKVIAKNISDYAKKEFPDVKLSRKTDYNGVDLYVMSSDKDLYISDKDIDNMTNKQLLDLTNNYGNSMFFDRWAKDNVPSYTTQHSFSADDVRRYMKEDLKTMRERSSNNVTGNEYFLSEYGKKVISGLNKEMNSYNYDDSDGQVDYFNTNFYGYVHIGKWDKPYEVSTKPNTTSSLKSAYDEYMRTHKNSTLSIEEFKKWYKK